MSDGISEDVSRHMRALLFALAHREDERAAAEAAATPYWSPCPASVVGHRAAADALRILADRFLIAAGPGDRRERRW